MTKQNLAALEIHYVLKELQFLVGGKLDKVYNPSKKELILVIHVPSKGKQILRIVAGKFLYLTEYKPKSEGASSFCVYLRKKLLGSRLRKLEQKGFERVIEFEFENSKEKHSLFFELFGKGNIVLVKDEIILSAVEQQKWAERSVMPKEKYVYPQKQINFLDMTEPEFRKFCKNSEQESIVKTLAMDIGLGKTYAEEVCLKAKIDKNSKPDLGRKKLEILFKALTDLKNGDKAYNYEQGTEISPLQLESYPEKSFKEFDTYNQALDTYFTALLKQEVKQGIEKAFNSETDKINKIIDIQRKSVERLESDEKLNREKGELLYNNYQLVSQVLLELRKALQKHSIAEIKKRLKDQKLIKSVNEKEKTVVIEL